VKRRGRGRPALPKTERKAAIFSVRLSPEERDQVELAAQAMGLKAASWARLALLDAAAKSSAVDQPGERAMAKDSKEK
jgi:hypothetical protein